MVVIGQSWPPNWERAYHLLYLLRSVIQRAGEGSFELQIEDLSKLVFWERRGIPSGRMRRNFDCLLIQLLIMSDLLLTRGVNRLSISPNPSQQEWLKASVQRPFQMPTSHTPPEKRTFFSSRSPRRLRKGISQAVLGSPHLFLWSRKAKSCSRFILLKLKGSERNSKAIQRPSNSSSREVVFWF